MTQEAILFSTTVTTTTAIANNRCVDFDGGYSTAAKQTFGVSMEGVTGTASLPANLAVAHSGTKIIEAGAVIAAGDYVEVVGAVGKVQPLSAGTTIGQAITAASADGKLIEVMLLQKQEIENANNEL